MYVSASTAICVTTNCFGDSLYLCSRPANITPDNVESTNWPSWLF